MINPKQQSIDTIQQINKDLEEVYSVLLSIEQEGDVEGFRQYLRILSCILDSASGLVKSSVRTFSLLADSEDLDLFKEYLSKYRGVMGLIGDVVERITSELVLKDKNVVAPSSQVH